MITEVAIQQQPGDRVVETPLHKIDINSFLDQIKKDKSWKDNDRKAITVFKTNDMRIVLYGIRKGTEMIKQKKDGKITVQMLQGKMQFKTEAQSVKMNKGEMLVLDEGAAYSIIAKKKAFFLLSFTPATAGNNIV